MTRTPHLIPLHVVAILAVAGALLAGCASTRATAPAEASESATPQPEASASPSITADETCAQLGDAETVMFNAELAYRDGRSSLQEVEGAWRLTQRMYSRIDVEPGTDLADAVAELQSTLDIVPIGAQGTVPYVPGESSIDTSGASDACVAAGASPGIEAWTGG